MTDLTKSVVRRITRDQLIVTIAPEGVYVRQVKRKKVYGPLSYGRLLMQCVRINIAADEKAKKLAKAAKKAARKGL